MAHLSDIAIAQAAAMQPIEAIAGKLGISSDELTLYGRHKAKLPHTPGDKKGKLILVTAITPTPAGEGKTTTSIGLGDGLCRLGKKAAIALREPSLGPVFGMKGGAAGGGYAQVVPMEDINLHFTGDLHAIGAANNLLAAMIDNHIHQGNALGIDPRRITWRRCMDMNDRQLRSIVSGLGGVSNGMPREDGFDITVASEVMAVLCLSDGIEDLKKRLAAMVVAYTADRKPVTAGDLHAQGAMAALLKEAMLPNLVQTLEGTPALMHGGPFANIAHGCNSVAATKLLLSRADYVVTEAGFGADLGAEKFIDIKCRMAGIAPSVVVVVATVRALKSHGGVDKAQLGEEDTEALAAGMPNLLRHVNNMRHVFGLPVVVAVNRFPSDTEQELAMLLDLCAQAGVAADVADVWGKGGAGAEALATRVAKLCEEPSSPQYAYEEALPLAEKVEALAKRVYGAADVSFDARASRLLAQFEKQGYGALPVCVAKTQYSFSDDSSRRGAPSGFTLHVRDARLMAGAGFVVVLMGDIMTMPGLPKVPSAEKIDIAADGRISGLF